VPLFDLPLAELQQYAPDVPEPDDFDAFWAATLKQADATPVLIDVAPADTGLSLVDTWDVTFAGYEGQPVRGWFTRPRGATGDLPAVVEYLGYGRGRGLPHERLTWAAAGYAHLLMDSRGQGDLYGSGGATPDPAPAAPGGPGVATRGILTPHDYYYRRLITDAARAITAARALPGVDPARVAAVGNSQGGGLALAAAGLVPDLAALMISAPFLCHIQRAIDLTDADPYGEIVRYLAVNREAEPAVRRTLTYVDGIHFARRATAPLHTGVGLRDTICPPSTVFAAYNHYAAPDRTIHVYPFNHHEGGDSLHTTRQLTWLASRLGS
jgi:cephalosporin-C deacetylase